MRMLDQLTRQFNSALESDMARWGVALAVLSAGCAHRTVDVYESAILVNDGSPGACETFMSRQVQALPKRWDAAIAGEVPGASCQRKQRASVEMCVDGRQLPEDVEEVACHIGELEVMRMVVTRSEGPVRQPVVALLSHSDALRVEVDWASPASWACDLDGASWPGLEAAASGEYLEIHWDERTTPGEGWCGPEDEGFALHLVAGANEP